jgi:hypothetical protein
MLSRLHNTFNLSNRQNIEQYITLFSAFIMEYMSITISTLSIWFIPQLEQYSFEIIQYISILEWYFIIVLLLNMMTWIMFNGLYIFEIYREIWLIRHFDYSKRYNSMHLTRYKLEYPDIFSNLSKLNWIYYLSYVIMKWISLLNTIITIIIIIKWNYKDYTTLTTLFINCWICYKKIHSGITISRDSLKNDIGYAYFNTQNISFNRIDPRFKRHQSNSNLGSRIETRANTPIANNKTPSPPGSLSNSIIGYNNNNDIINIQHTLLDISITDSDII